MNKYKTLNLFYEEPDPDRWIKYDRYVRKFIRRIVRGKQKPGGVMMIALQLIKGLDALGIPYRFNDYKYAKNHPKELIGVIGKPQLIFEKRFNNPILFGSGVYSHPIECPNLFVEYPNIKRILVPGPWMKNMFDPYYPEKVSFWPAGIDTDRWMPSNLDVIKYDFIIYNKIIGNNSLKNEIIKILVDNKLTYTLIEYGFYTQEELLDKLKQSKSAIFLSKSETQGFAYQQILSTNIPMLAYDEGEYWKDPYYFPHKVKFKPVSSVPYWSKSCGEKFRTIVEFKNKLPAFLDKRSSYNPRGFIISTLTLEISAKQYYDIYNSLAGNLL